MGENVTGRTYDASPSFGWTFALKYLRRLFSVFGGQKPRRAESGETIII